MMNIYFNNIQRPQKSEPLSFTVRSNKKVRLLAQRRFGVKTKWKHYYWINFSSPCYRRRGSR